MGGASLAMLFITVLTHKRAKTILFVSCVLFVVFNLTVFAAYGLSHRAPTIRIFLLGVGWFIGMATTSAILLWLERRSGGVKQNGGGDLAATENVAG
jgi:hypothetical protein